MVWPFSSSPSNNGTTSSTTDPYSKLDPSLRQFLDRGPNPPPTQPTPAPTTQPTPTPNTQPLPSHSQQPPSPPSNTPTLFPDGRYAHLWSTYQPQTSIESSQKSDQERLSDVLSAWKERNASIGKAALENCAAINTELDECWRNPSWKQRFTICRTESKALERCVTMNQRFLKTLGYLSALDRPEAEREAIQMHADRLYMRMLERERERKEGGDGGSGDGGGGGVDAERRLERPLELERLSEHGKRQLEDRVKGLDPVERDLEERAFAAEIRAGAETMQQVEKYRSEARQARTERIESGQSRPSDRLQSWLGR